MTPGDRSRRKSTVKDDPRTDEPSTRSLELLRRIHAHRSDVPSVDFGDGYGGALLDLLDAAVPEFCEWCAIDLVDHLPSRRVAVRRARCDADDSAHTSCDASLQARVPQLAAMVTRVSGGGPTEVWPAEEGALSLCAVVGLSLNDRPVGAVTFALDDRQRGYTPAEVAVAEHVVVGVGVAMERFALQKNARDAVRESQRLASQLHQLIAASITVTGLQREQDILMRLATSTRSVFDADDAVVSLESGPLAPLVGVARRGQGAAYALPGGDASPVDAPKVRPGSLVPWTDDEWLVAPIAEGRGTTRGTISVRRKSSAVFSDEEREILTLLAQMASTTLGAVELSRSIQHSEARWRVLVETAPVGIVEVDANGAVQWWNRAAGRIFHWPEFSEEQIGAVGFPDSTLPGLKELWSGVLVGELATSRDFVDVEVAGRPRVLTASASLLPGVSGQTPIVLTLIDDVTNHAQLKAELRHAQTMETRGQVASRIAHDFNNLLTLISGYAEILSQDLASSDRELQMVHDIQATSSRASLLTAQLQTIGRTRPRESVVLDPIAAIQSNAEVLERILGGTIDLAWSLDDESANIRVDADQFEQMILNLVFNARDAMPDGGRLRISVEPVTVDAERGAELALPEGEYTLIGVADTGIGMDDDTAQQCFEPLFTTKGPFKGTGMGLAAARRLVEESDGAIRCLSHLGEGTTFEILFPSVSDEPAPLPDVEAALPRGSAVVLVVDDDDGVLRLASQVLQRNGYRVLEADSSAQAIERFRGVDGQIDLLVSDVVMSDQSGRELAGEFQESHPTLRVLLMSGTADASILNGLVAGTTAFLAKPFKPSELIDRVHELLARRTP